MSNESFQIAAEFQASPMLVYATWLSSVGHSEMTGAEARCVPGIGGEFTAWDGFIWGTNVDLDPPNRIIQNWRTLEFPEDADWSLLTLSLDAAPLGCSLTVHHEKIPAGMGGRLRQAWVDHYFVPMQAYFVRLAAEAMKPKPKNRPKPVYRKVIKHSRVIRPKNKLEY